MPSKLIILSAVFLVAPWGQTAKASEEWLIGEWQGYIQRVPDPTGITAEWAGADLKFIGARGSVTNGQVQITNAANRTAILKREGDAKLVGTFSIPGSQPLQMSLIKALATNKFDGAWKGEAEGNGCWTGYYDLTVNNGGISGSVNFNEPRGSIPHTSHVTGEIWLDGSAVIVLAADNSTSRTSYFHATATEATIVGTDPSATTKGCSYKIALKRR